VGLLVESKVRDRARLESQRVRASMESLLHESQKVHRLSYDIFLSHSKLDSELILGVKLILESNGHSVYVDWISDPQLDRARVSAATAAKLRVRMGQSQSLFYVHSKNASTSRWMPWELGYFDGHNGNVAVLPIVDSESFSFHGEEYLGLYPYVDVTGSTVYIHRDIANYKSFADWRRSSDKLRPSV
jgi:hypothetical protein